MLTKGLQAEARNKLDAIMAQIAEAVASRKFQQTDVIGSKSQLLVGKKKCGKEKVRSV